jgi:hypothetical protein
MGKKKDWYDLHIEKPIQNLVRLLRNNGFNTFCSCGHLPSPYVQMEGHYPEEMGKLVNLLLDNGYKNFCVKFVWENQDCLQDFGKFMEVGFTILHLSRRKKKSKVWHLARESDIRNIKNKEKKT